MKRKRKDVRRGNYPRKKRMKAKPLITSRWARDLVAGWPSTATSAEMDVRWQILVLLNVRVKQSWKAKKKAEILKLNAQLVALVLGREPDAVTRKPAPPWDDVEKNEGTYEQH
jgi:hypothetical protein